MDENENLLPVEETEELPAPEAAGESGEGAAAEENAPRDFDGEVSTLLQVFPELAGQSLPDEVVEECIGKGTPLVRAYADYQENAAAVETDARYRRMENADRAPVRAVSLGAPVGSAPSDPFLMGLNEY